MKAFLERFQLRCRERNRPFGGPCLDGMHTI
jgi:hypothetical protein